MPLCITLNTPEYCPYSALNTAPVLAHAALKMLESPPAAGMLQGVTHLLLLDAWQVGHVERAQ